MPMQESEPHASTEPAGNGVVALVGPQPARQSASEVRSASRPPAVSYLGFRTTNAGREYTLRVTGGSGPRHFVLLITHAMFASVGMRFQDAPGLCFARLQRDLAADPDLHPGPLVELTTEELVAFRRAGERHPQGRKRRPVADPG
jgi:hypothetical protein